MVMRASWGPLFSWGVKTNQTFAAVFARGQAMGLQTWRRSVMLGIYRIRQNRGVTPSMFRSLPRREIVPRAWLGERGLGQRRKFRYLVELKGFNQQTGLPAFRHVSIESETQLTSNQIVTKAWAQWGEIYEGAVDKFESVELIGGRGK